MTLQRIDAGARMSDAVIHHQTLYYTSVAANAALDEDITGQTVSALAAIDAMLARCNTDKRRLLDATIFLPNAADFAAMNAVWDNWVEAGSAPVRCTVQAGLMNPRYKIEIKIISALLRTGHPALNRHRESYRKDPPPDAPQGLQ